MVRYFFGYIMRDCGPAPVKWIEDKGMKIGSKFTSLQGVEIGKETFLTICLADLERLHPYKPAVGLT